MQHAASTNHGATAVSSPVSLPPVLLGQQVLHVGKHEAAKEAVAVPPCPADLAVLPFKRRNLGEEDRAALLVLCRQRPRTCAGLERSWAPWCCKLVAQHKGTLSMPASYPADNSPDGVGGGSACRRCPHPATTAACLPPSAQDDWGAVHTASACHQARLPPTTPEPPDQQRQSSAVSRRAACSNRHARSTGQSPPLSASGCPTRCYHLLIGTFPAAGTHLVSGHRWARHCQ